MEKKKIMVVDDEVDFLKIVKLNLEETGKYEILALSSAKDIISHVNNFRPDLILLDIVMPVVGGIDACEMLNKDLLGKTIPIIIISALDKSRDKLKAYKKGVVDYIVKPIEKESLIIKIEKALQFK
ncbi:MAG: response regulator [Candidatus Omnitrophica bacterium]|nr:response regulator [Candidatus Omnitrophota bacterium]